MHGVKDIIRDAESLPAEERIAVIDSLLRTLNRPSPEIDKAWITTNMFPMGNGDITGKRDLTTGQEILTLDIEFTGISQYGMGVNKFAQTILDGINTSHADPFMRPAPLTGVSSDVGAAANGYKAWTETVGSTAVTNMTT